MTAALTLALGIGAATAVFSVVSAGLLRQLPYANPDRLVVLWQEYTQRGRGIVPVSQPNFTSIARQARSFDGFVAVRFGNTALTGDNEPEMLSGAAVTPGGFQLLGVEAAVGRTLREADAGAAAGRTAVLSDAFWRRRFGADRQIIGRSIVLDGEPTTVVGVMAHGFTLPPRFRATVGGNPITVPAVDVWTPLVVDANPGLTGHRNLVVIARLAPGATVAVAREEAAVIAPRLLDEFPGPANRGLTLNLVPLPEQVSGNIRRPLMLLLGAVTLVLLVACANVASMLMSRGVDQRGEVALRAALGASRARLVGQALVEGLVLSAVGGTAGALVASWLTRALALSIEAQLPQLQGITVDAGVLAFALLLTLATAVIFGTVPALYRSTQAPRAHFSSVAVGATVPRLGRWALVAIQAGLVVVLLAGAGVFARSFAALVAVDPGFDASRVVTVGFDLPANRYSSIEQRVSFQAQLVAALRAVPGVAAVGVTSRVPLAGASGTGGLTIAGRDATDPAGRPHAAPIIIDDGNLEAMGIRIVRGRPFNADDRTGAPPVALVNSRAAQLFWPGQNAIGQRVRPDGMDHWLTIVGVVEDVRQVAVATLAEPALYWPFAQRPRELDGGGRLPIGVVARGTLQADVLLAAVRQPISKLDSSLPATLVASLDDLVAQSVGEPKLFSIMLGLFAVCGLLVAATGLYGVLSHLVAQRRREIGVRLALGAGPGRVMVAVLVEGVLPVAAGIAPGLAAAVLIGPSLAGQLHDVSPTDGVALTAAALMLMTVAVAACYLPARRAARLDPAATLRLES